MNENNENFNLKRKLNSRWDEDIEENNQNENKSIYIIIFNLIILDEINKKNKINNINKIQKNENKIEKIENKEENTIIYNPLIEGCRSIDCYEKVKYLGQGTYGTVYLAKDIKNNQLYALKKVKIEPRLANEGFPITALREISSIY